MMTLVLSNEFRVLYFGGFTGDGYFSKKMSGCIPALKSGDTTRHPEGRKVKRAVVFELTRLTDQQQIILGYLLRDYAQKVSNLIKELAVRSGEKTVVIGRVQVSKNKENNLPDLVNQMFKLFPHRRVTEYLRYKLKELGIEVKLIDESYTSVTDSCDEKARVTRTSKGNGRRIKRGLFLSPIKGLINADVNGARNILRKFKKKWCDLVTGLKKVVRIRIYEFGKGISESLQFTGIGVEVGVNPPRGIRAGATYQTPSEAYYLSRR